LLTQETLAGCYLIKHTILRTHPVQHSSNLLGNYQLVENTTVSMLFYCWGFLKLTYTCALLARIHGNQVLRSYCSVSMGGWIQEPILGLRAPGGYYLSNGLSMYLADQTTLISLIPRTRWLSATF